MKSFFRFLSEQLGATMVTLAGFAASVAAIADAIKKNKKIKAKWRYVWLITVLLIFLLSLAYLAGQYTARSKASTDESVQIDDTQEIPSSEAHPSESSQDKPAASQDGYTIYLSADSAVMGEEFKIYIIPNEENVIQILVHAEGPSGQGNTYEWKSEKKFIIDEEAGTWKIWATIVSEAGIYEGNKTEEFAAIEIKP